MFTEQVLVGELDIYRTEGLIIGEKDFMHVETTSVESRQCLELFNGLPKKRNKKGLFSVLESHGRTIAATERGFFKELKKCIRKYPAYESPHPSERLNSFIVRHYAGPVKYTTGDFLEKNDDSLPEEVELLFKSSKHQVVSSFASLHAARRDKAMARQKRLLTMSRRNPSVSNAFTVQIKELANELSKSGCHYIRCVKPNPTLYFGINEGGLSSLSNNEQVIDEVSPMLTHDLVMNGCGNKLYHVCSRKHASISLAIALKEVARVGVKANEGIALALHEWASLRWCTIQRPSHRRTAI